MYPKTVDRRVRILPDHPLSVWVGPEAERFVCLAKAPARVRVNGTTFIRAISNTLHGGPPAFGEKELALVVAAVEVDTPIELRFRVESGATFTFRPLTPETLGALEDSQLIGVSSLRERLPSPWDQIVELDRTALASYPGWLDSVLEDLDNPLEDG